MTTPRQIDADPLRRAGQLGVGMHELGAGEADAEYGSRSRPPTRAARVGPPALLFRPAAPMRMRRPIRQGTIILPPWSEWRSIGEPTSRNDRPESPVEHVRRVQIWLNRALGLRLRVTGTMDAATRSAVRSFQKKYGLLVDGVVDRSTESVLRATRALAQNFEFATEAIVGMTNPAAAGRPCGCADSAKKTRPCSCHDKQRKPVRRRRLRGAPEPWRVRNEW
jgi:hypothetical protein